MKNKVGLITFHDTTNFGSLLQTYGLYKKIQDLGHDIDVLDYTCEEIRKREIPSFPKLDKSFPRRLISYLFFSKKSRKKYEELSKFLKKNMNVSKKINNIEELHKINSIYDNFVCGSDLIWDLKITNNDYSYFLDFADKEKNIFSFASAGAKWDDIQKDKLKKIFNNFNNINVRDDGTQARVQEIAPTKNVNVVCDPTMLLTKEYWESFTKESLEIGEYILIYFLDDENKVYNFAKYLEEKTGLRIYYINNGRKKSGLNNKPVYSIEEFLTLIKNAKYVVTSSYHGLLFSLYFNKKMWFYNRAHKDRMKNIMSKLSISSNEIRDDSDYETLFTKKIDYNLVNNQLEEYRNFSIEKLKEALIGEKK